MHENEETKARRPLSPAQLRQRREAALVHGLRARSRHNLRSHNYRVAALIKRTFELCHWLRPQDAPAVRRWAELEALAADAFAAAQADPANEKVHLRYLSITRAQLPWTRELGFTPAVRSSMGLEKAPIDLVQLIDAERPS